MHPMHPSILACAILALAAATTTAQEEPLTSGRPMPPEQECFDVQHYYLDVEVFPETQTIRGALTMDAELLELSDGLILDLHQDLEVIGVYLAAPGAALGSLEVEGWRALAFEHAAGEIRIDAAGVLPDVGQSFKLRVEYGGKPRVAPRSPWDGGFLWQETKSGQPWIATANQMQGADLWWPCKDQPSDEPEGMDILVTVPKGLICASNGRLVQENALLGERTQFHWRVSTPINAYGVALNIAPYELITQNYKSVTGESFPVSYWVLPENFEKGQLLFQDLLRQLAWFESVFGPYPFRRDKCGLVETPHLGMEHQSITAYGNEYRGNPWGADRGFDYLLHHELAHEWFANLVTARNWKDFWIHESFGTYAQALYAEHLLGAEAYRANMAETRQGHLNKGACAPTEELSSAQVYFGDQAGDIYNKGAWVLHSLRWLVGDYDFFIFLRRVVYPWQELENTSDGSACRFTDTEEIRNLAEKYSRRDLGWFFDIYLRQPALPELISELEEGLLTLTWKVPGERPFPMPVEVRVGDRLRRVDMSRGTGRVLVGEKEYEVDPNRWLLKLESE